MIGDRLLLILVAVATASLAALYLGRLISRKRAGLAARRQRLEAEAREQHERLGRALTRLLGDEYVAASELAAWATANGDVVTLAAHTRFIDHLAEPEASIARERCRQVRDLADTVRAHNERFIAARLDEERQALDRVERYPLTERQRLAIVTDQDNDLVVAGAGTGKTSTIVGKVDYLIRRRLAAPE